MTTDTIFWIASMTKAVTSVAAMQLVEQGKLHLDEPIERVLPELTTVKVLEGFSESGEPRLRAPKRPMTLRHLLTQSNTETSRSARRLFLIRVTVGNTASPTFWKVCGTSLSGARRVRQTDKAVASLTLHGPCVSRT
ncbi:serine hydrolase domain-containing protein [Alicyclobacillus acidoterrestris]|uniref:Beta-lactamase family protein n=1 Tax=Alicyclobacillus acidoterrestris (strain ATCC 49025 / DSM 3922 / CIP 106132 / NCIMB 13137 / GD3B) TaxID=1356854 RepID=A0A9E6ZQJ3_ALIAG|nr:serine hydrolase domain-containing protein [Alicyclobacillus acidoterrestris]UNO47299.1 beta-lactamase family protein [Alicyclobacillus acidoterrestris]